MRKNTGLRRSDAYRIMLDVSGRLTRNPDGTWALPSDCTRMELKLVECVSSLLVVKPAFEADRLVDDFIETLRSNGLITTQEIRTHRDEIKLIVQLYAVAAMHNCVVQVGDGTTTQLKAGVGEQGKRIEVYVEVPDAVPWSGNIRIRSAIFSIGVDAAIHCHPELLTADPWNFEIELSPDRRLVPLR
jgi:hypothetical protein